MAHKYVNRSSVVSLMSLTSLEMRPERPPAQRRDAAPVRHGASFRPFFLAGALQAVGVIGL
ncbi:hypothetical protein CCR97_03050 [Rhodoplanes elegans]|uniref:Uncharacterized protein n=1 Tax=Rhodoplanes elegans TaxID=29408 RepID=A0A327JMC0_9BRAD|nr:hypothetical protein [Rhodoplanes elegans]RAI26736.1 hypothetical protein CH338_30525 [Rhodoplanes elegans]